ncbi:MAG: hypothetical protein KDA75_09805 [Planctomycetaceae bacterium]|nr:hypothetical protein [Planctomycetaceae bacterium]
MKPVSLLLLIVWGASPVVADSPPETALCQPVELLTSESFARPDAFDLKGKPGATGWRPGIGEWKIVDGAAYAIQEGPSEKRPNGHEAVCEYVTNQGDLVLTAEFKLGDSPQVGFVCRDTNSPNLHLGRVLITPTAIWVQKMSGIAKETRKEELTRMPVQLDPQTWHRVTVEVCGDRWLARIDDHTIEGSHARFQDRKGRVGFVARGEGAQFRNVAVWSATAKPQ